MGTVCISFIISNTSEIPLILMTKGVTVQLDLLIRNKSTVVSDKTEVKRLHSLVLNCPSAVSTMRRRGDHSLLGCWPQTTNRWMIRWKALFVQIKLPLSTLSVHACIFQVYRPVETEHRKEQALVQSKEEPSFLIPLCCKVEATVCLPNLVDTKLKEKKKTAPT